LNGRTIVAATMVCDGTVGATPGDIPAALFGLRVIEETGSAIKNDNTLIVECVPAFDGKSLLGKAAGTGAPAVIPAGTYAITLIGPSAGY
jgi:hypothetical protein